MAGHHTLRSGGTAGGQTGVLAGTFPANLLVSTVRVQQTAGQTVAGLAEVSLRTGDTAAALLPAPSLHTALPALAVLAGPALLHTDPALAPVSPPAVRAGGAGEGERETLQAGVPGGRSGAGAEGLVGGHLALGTPPAGGGGAGVLALGVDAGLAGPTLGVRGAAGNTESLPADGAVTAVSVAVAERPAGSLDTDLVEETVLAGGGALGDTLPGHTLVAGPALPAALTGLGRVAAGSGGVSGEGRRAGAEGLVLPHTTDGVAAALAGAGLAGVHTLVVDAGQLAGTVGAGAAAQDTGHSLADLLAVTVSVHPAHRFTKAVVAHLVVAAGFVVEADIFTELAVTDLSLRALGVTGADLGLLHTGHGRTGVGDEAGWTGAGGAVVHHLALSVGTAGRAAGVRAPVVDAGVGLGAVLVLPAANQAHLVEADVAQETVVVHPAGHCKVEQILDFYFLSFSQNTYTCRDPADISH